MRYLTLGEFSWRVAASLCCVNGDVLVVRASQGTPKGGAGRAQARPLRSSCAPRWRAPTELGQVRTAGGGSSTSPAAVEGPGSRARCGPAAPTGRSSARTAFTELDTRYTIETDKGQLVYVQNPGMRHAPPDVMKKLLAGEAGRPRARLLPDAAEVRDLGAGTAVAHSRDLRRLGERYPSEVVIRFFRVE
jgi:hypothetical protein